MTTYASDLRPAQISWRTIEWSGAAIAMFLQSGAVFPLLLMANDGVLDASDQSRLRLLSLPVYLITLALLSRHLGQFLLAVWRSFLLFMLMIMPFVSVIWSISPSVSLRRAVGLFMSMLFAYLLAMRFSPRQIAVLVAWVTGTAMALSIVVAAGMPHLGFMLEEGAMRGVYPHKNVLGWSAALAVLSGAALAYDRQLGMRRMGLTVLFLGIACVLLSKSATSLLACVTSLVLFGFYHVLKKSRGFGRFMVVFVFLEIVVLTLIWLSNFLVPLLESLGKDATLTGRVPLWKLVDEAIAERLWLGYGYQAFWTEGSIRAWQIWSSEGWKAPHAHSGYRDTILNFGIFGLLLLGAVLAQALTRGARLVCAEPEGCWVWLNILVGMSLVINLAESKLLAQNDLHWIIMTTAIVLFAIRGKRDPI
jgi:exopolysaccharide production protein ExoQ